MQCHRSYCANISSIIRACVYVGLYNWTVIHSIHRFDHRQFSFPAIVSLHFFLFSFGDVAFFNAKLILFLFFSRPGLNVCGALASRSRSTNFFSTQFLLALNSAVFIARDCWFFFWFYFIFFLHFFGYGKMCIPRYGLRRAQHNRVTCRVV